MLIEKKRSELDKLVLTRITDLSTDDIVALSNELDHLIAIYINLIEGEKKP
jgi:isochorismate synthase EntC